jgi:endonuclease/exonuclease/phosphatase family metal-dependent hydrolase
MRIATFNLENLFDRPEIMNQDDVKLGKQVLDDYSKLNKLIAKDKYLPAVKQTMLDIMSKYNLTGSGESKYILLRVINGAFVKNGRPPSIVANGRTDWIGWFELTPGTVNEAARGNTARVIRELHSDIVCVMEAENRIALKHFNQATMPKVSDKPFDHVMAVDGNDERPIDVGIMVRAPYSIERIISHVDDKDDHGEIFSRDCAEYLVTGDSGEQVLLLVNHFKSKGFGSQASNDAKRTRQARRVRDIYEQRQQEGFKYVAVVGDLNDFPGSQSLKDLLQNGMRDISTHPKFLHGDGRPGTYKNGTEKDKIDYILLSPELYAKVVDGGVERRGVWGGKDGKLFKHFDEITKPVEAASDHAALWAEVEL